MLEACLRHDAESRDPGAMDAPSTLGPGYFAHAKFRDYKGRSAYDSSL
jgi:hypothetical protein